MGASRWAWILLVFALPLATYAQTPRVPPRPGYSLLSEETVDRFRVERWASPDSPTDSPSGWCDCITQVFEASRLLIDLGTSGSSQRFAALADVTGDARAELVVVNHSGGAHCCESTIIYSFGNGAPATLLDVETGSCPGELTDVDGDGTVEFRTCDDHFAYEFCSFAYSPLPPVVFAYDRTQRRFVLATRRYAPQLPAPTEAEVKAAFDDARSDPELLRCAAVGPALHAAYTVGIASGQRRFRELYQGADAETLEARMVALVRTSSLWTPD